MAASGAAAVDEEHFDYSKLREVRRQEPRGGRERTHNCERAGTCLRLTVRAQDRVFISLCGLIGAGKSTLTRALADLVR
jgi:pantothenate kinase